MSILEGSRAIALTIKKIKPNVISAYPITPQTHIVEDLAKFKADGQADYSYVRAESEFAAASIVAGASATGARVYTATSSQGLLLMVEVVFNIAGMRLPVVMTCANRGVSAPITIWNDHQDAMTIRDSGWIMFFAENHQESVNQHILAYKIAEKMKLPAVVNIDGFVLTHSYEEVEIPSDKIIKKFLPDRNPAKGEFLDPKNPVTFGAFATPAHYMEIRQDLHNDLRASKKIILDEYQKLSILINNKYNPSDNGLFEYYGPKKPKTLLIAMGSVAGTIKDVIDISKKTGLLKIKTYRPFPGDEILPILKYAKYIAVIDKSISLGSVGPLAMDIKTTAQGKIKAKIKSYVAGLGGRDITKKMIEDIISDVSKRTEEEMRFIGKNN
jgi:pyruvate ferredoxin oxidoreductase alpha subunit